MREALIDILTQQQQPVTAVQLRQMLAYRGYIIGNRKMRICLEELRSESRVKSSVKGYELIKSFAEAKQSIDFMRHYAFSLLINARKAQKAAEKRFGEKILAKKFNEYQITMQFPEAPAL